MISPALQRVIDSMGSFGLSLDNDGIVTSVVAPFQSAADSPAAAAGIVPGDRIDLKAMRCIPLDTPQCASLVTVLGGLGITQSVVLHRHVTLTILPRSGAPSKTVELQSVPAPLKPAERAVLLADTVVAVVVIVIAFWLVWTRPSWMTWGLFLYVIWMNPGQAFTYYALLQRWPLALLAQEFVESLAQGAAFGGLMLFALRFPDDRTEPRWQKVQWAVPLLAIAMAVVTLLCFVNVFGFHTERITEASFLAGYAIDAVVLLILLDRRRSLPLQEQQRMSWVIWGCAIGLPAYILAELFQSSDLILRLFGFTPSPALIGILYLPNGVLAYFASQAVWQRRVVSVSIPLRHGTTLVALTLLIGVPIFQLEQKVDIVKEAIPLPAWIWPLLVAPVVLLLVNRLHESAVELVDRVFNRRFHSAKRQLKDACNAIAKAESLAEIDRLVVDCTVSTLCLSSGAVFRSEGNVFRREQNTKGWDDSMKKELQPKSDAIVLRSLELGAPVRLTHEDCDSLRFPTGMEAPSLSLPVRSGIPEATAVVLLGPHDTGNDIDADEREMLDQFAERAAAAYERVVTTHLRQEVAQLKAQVLELQSGDRTARASS